MSGYSRWGLVSAIVLVPALAGCATKDKQQIALLQETNRDLAERLNATQVQIDANERDRRGLDQRLIIALAELDGLKERLADRPAQEPAAAGWTPIPGGAMIAIDARVLFAPGRVALRDKARQTLDGIASTLQGEYAGKDVLVVGHTDDRPIKKSGWTDNLQLSAERALAVSRYLQKRGVSPTRLIAGGAGEFRPRRDNTSDANRATNRRVEILAIESPALAQRP